MKDTRPIELQVSELTPEQKKTIRRVGICYDIVMCLVVILYLAVSLPLMFQLESGNRQIANYSFMKTVTVDGVAVEQYDPDAHVGYESLLAQQEQNMTTFAVVMGVGLVVVLATMGISLLIIAHKYPYYSDKRFVYIGKQNRKKK